MSKSYRIKISYENQTCKCVTYPCWDKYTLMAAMMRSLDNTNTIHVDITCIDDKVVERVDSDMDAGCNDD
jgi:inosine-uridine nucleoside N-ribohydrolase